MAHDVTAADGLIHIVVVDDRFSTENRRGRYKEQAEAYQRCERFVGGHFTILSKTDSQSLFP
jgi:hypothetical protein